MVEFEILNKLETILVQEDYDCAIEPATDEFPMPQLLVHLGLDSKERERTLMIITDEPEPETGLNGKEHATIQPISTIQFTVPLPFNFTDDTHHDVLSIVCFINSMVELPGFEIEEMEDSVHFRYVLITQINSITPVLINSVISAITLLLDLFSDLLEKVALGEATFEELVQTLLEIAANKDEETNQ